jgi:colanic acid/amylovoran biosynthesis glycosyltransferase
VAEPTIAYLLKMYPRFSETFVLAELLELERQGARLHVFSLKKPNDGVFHADVARLRARVTYVPESVLLDPRPYAAAHRETFGRDRRRYVRALGAAAARRRSTTMKHFLRAGYIAPLLRRHGITHVHAHFASSPAAVALHLHRLTGVSYSFTAHAKDIYIDTTDQASLAAKLRAARFVVTVSDFNRAHLSALAGSNGIVRIYNGVDLDRFAPNGVRGDDPPLVLAVGRLIEKKGLSDLVRACALLRARGLSFRCMIVGKGPLERELKRLARELKVGDLVELAGPRPREQLLELYRRASVFAAPCVVGSDGNRDGLPTVLVEAMALGVPVVSTDVTGIPELVENGNTGIVVPQHAPEALADAIERLLDDRLTALALAAGARARIEQEFDLRRNVAQLRSLLEGAAHA